MTTKTTPPNSDGISKFLNSILKQSATDMKDEISTDDFSVLVTSVKILAQELQSITRSVELIINAMEQQNAAIGEIYSVQEFVLKQLKSEAESNLETSLTQPVNKVKKEKPN